MRTVIEGIQFEIEFSKEEFALLQDKMGTMAPTNIGNVVIKAAKVYNVIFQGKSVLVTVKTDNDATAKEAIKQIRLALEKMFKEL